MRTIAGVGHFDKAGMLAKDDLSQFVKIIQKYNTDSAGIVYEDHDPEVDLWEKPEES